MSLKCTETGKESCENVGFHDAETAYNEICKNVYGGGMWPDEKLKEQCPYTHNFFMRLFGYCDDKYMADTDVKREGGDEQ